MDPSQKGTKASTDIVVGGLTQLPVTGHQPATKAAKGSAVKAVTKFLNSSNGVYPPPWESLPPEIICTEAFWRSWAQWAVYSEDPIYAANTVVEYTRKFMGLVESKWSAHSPDFFRTIHDTSQASNWYKGLLAQVHVVKFHKAAKSGEAVQKQAPPVYIEHRREISRQLRLKGDTVYQMENAVIQINGFAAGRPGT